MHLEVLVEDQSGKVFLQSVLKDIVGNNDTFRVISYKGIGHIPKNLAKAIDANRRVLLNQLPKLLNGYGETFSHYPPGSKSGVVIVCDLDSKDRDDFLRELTAVLNACFHRPDTIFCLVDRI